ncbi:NusG domain II-containing protein ['Paenibacillus yunnanensis' Narsing Rao et al. 2020]|uniref:NusG domain II-containing protein n=1 Tax=Paenibacillus tengchongensis TaxID=2608684 RepID=UPI00124D9603|nr:NusG domain II-containing protein [Paenibacillus tengchongensis]
MQKLKRGDIVLILVVLLAAAAFYGVKWLNERNEHFTQGELQAVISINGKTYQTVPLTKEEQIIDIKTKFGHNTLKVYDYGIEMTYSDAPLPIALDMGFISRPKQQIICIPARLMVEVVNPDPSPDDKDALDAVI